MHAMAWSPLKDGLRPAPPPVWLAKQFEDAGVSAIVFTDIGRDGALTGVNIDATVELAEAVNIPVIAGGGLKTSRI